MLDLSAPPRVRLAAPQQHVGAQPVVGQVARDIGQRMGIDHAGPQLGQVAFRTVGVAVEELVGDGQAQHGVAEELQALVGRQPAVSRRHSCGGSTPARAVPSGRSTPSASSSSWRDGVTAHPAAPRRASSSGNIAANLAHRGSMLSWWWPGSAASETPHSGHSPGQSGRHTGENGSSSPTASMIGCSRSTVSDRRRARPRLPRSSPRWRCPGTRTARSARSRTRPCTGVRQRAHSPAVGAPTVPVTRTPSETDSTRRSSSSGAPARSRSTPAPMRDGLGTVSRTVNIAPGRRPSRAMSTAIGDARSPRRAGCAARHREILRRVAPSHGRSAPCEAYRPVGPEGWTTASRSRACRRRCGAGGGRGRRNASCR